MQAGPPLNLWDNVAGNFGGAPVDQLLTSDMWADRRLGHTQAIRFPNKTTWMATSNNAQIVGDLARRLVFVRLVAPTSRPEDRGGFKIPDVRA